MALEWPEKTRQRELAVVAARFCHGEEELALGERRHRSKRSAKEAAKLLGSQVARTRRQGSQWDGGCRSGFGRCEEEQEIAVTVSKTFRCRPLSSTTPAQVRLLARCHLSSSTSRDG
jgi:hypothetical protein